MFKINPKNLGRFDVAVCGGGVAGAAAQCAKRKLSPSELDGVSVSEFMRTKGYEL